MRGCWLAAWLVALCACSSPPPREAVTIALAPQPADEGRRFPMAGQINMKLVEDRLLGKNFLPGGNLAEYRQKGKTYQQFLVRAKSPEAAALLLFDFKSHLRDAKFLAHMGGYFGMDGEQPVYIFQKSAFLAGFVGLPEKDADPLARQFATRLN